MSHAYLVIIVATLLFSVATPALGDQWTPGLKYNAEHGCVLFKNGTTACFGFGLFGPFAIGREDQKLSTAPLMPFPGSDVENVMRDVAVGTSSTCGIMTSGEVYCFGMSAFGARDPQVTLPKPEYWGTLPGDVENVKPALLNDTSWHTSEMALCGVGVSACFLTSYPKYAVVCAGDGKTGFPLMETPLTFYEWGDGYSPRDVLITPLSFDPVIPIVKLYSFQIQTCALFENLRLKCWGLTFTYDFPGVVIGDNAPERSLLIADNTQSWVSLDPIFDQRLIDIAGGKSHILMLNIDGLIIAGGYADRGQLGNTGTLGGIHGLSPSNSITKAPAIVFSDTVPAKSVCSGYQHSCALFENRKARCWGSNSRGQLGLPSVSNYTGAFLSEMATLPYIALPGDVLEMACGLHTTCAMLNASTIPGREGGENGWVCWGAGANFRLGNDDSTDIDDPSVLVDPIPHTNDTNVKLWDLFPRLSSAIGGLPLDIRGPLFELERVSKVRLTDPDNALIFQDVDVNTTLRLPHLLRTDLIPPWAMGARTTVHTKIDLLDASDNIVVSGADEGFGELTYAVGVAAGTVSTPTGLVANVPFSLGITLTGYAAAGLGLKSHGVCTIGGESYVLSYAGDGDNLACIGVLGQGMGVGEYDVAVTIGGNFVPVVLSNKLQVIAPFITEVEPFRSQLDAKVNLTITGEGYVNLAEGALCRFSDPADPPLLSAMVTTVATVVDNATVLCERPEFPDLASAPILPYSLNLEISLNAGVHWTSKADIEVFARVTLTLALPGALPVMGGVTLTVHGSGFVSSASAMLKLTQSGHDPIFVASQLATASQLFETVTPRMPEGTGLLIVDLAVDGQTYTNAPVTTTVFEIISLKPSSGPVAGGTPVTVTGRGFTAVTGSLFCAFSLGVTSVPAAYGTKSQIVCVSPPSPSGSMSSYTFGVTFNGNDYDHTENTTYSYYEPTYSDIVPPFAPSDISMLTTDSIAVTATGLEAVPESERDKAKCKISGVETAAIVDVARGTVNCTLYPGLVSEPISIALNGINFELTGLSLLFFELYQAVPASGPISGGNAITILGARFPTSPVPLCRFGSVSVAGIRESPSRLVCTVPSKGAVSGGAFFDDTPLDISFDAAGIVYSDGPLFYKYFAEPHVTAIFPRSGQFGHEISLYGTNFTDSIVTGLAMRCKFGSMSEVATSDALLGGGTHFSCFAPPQSGVVTLEASFNDGSSYTSDGIEFVYMSVLSVGPNLAPASGNTDLLVSGSGFFQTLNSTCRFTVNALGPVYVEVPAVVLSAGQLRCPTPVTAPNPSVVVEVTNDQVAYTADGISLNLYAVPTLTAVDPTHVPGTGGVTVTVHGSNFADTGLIRFKLGPIVVPCSFSSGSAVLCDSPASSGKQEAWISFNNAYDYHTALPDPSAVSVTFVALSSAEPVQGPSGGGTSVLLSGFGLKVGPAAGVICRYTLLTGPAAPLILDTPAVATSSGQGSCDTPPIPGGLAGGGYLDVSVDGGANYTVNSIKFGFYSVPDVTAVVPSNGPEQGGFLVTVYGANLNATEASRWSGTDKDVTEIAWCKFGRAATGIVEEISVPAAVGSVALVCMATRNVGSVEVEVSLNGGYHYSTSTAVPKLAYYTVFLSIPAAGPTTGATSVLIFGSNFAPSASAVCQFGVVPTAAVYVSSGQVRCISPPHTPSDVVVKYAHDNTLLFTEDTTPFKYFIGPTVDAISPSHAPLGSGAVVSVLGTGFFDTPDFICMFGSTVSVNTSFISPTLVICPMPDGDGVVELKLSFNGGSQFTAGGPLFHYITLNNIFPVIGPLSGSTKMFFVGSGFKDTEGAKCRFGTLETPARVSSATSLECDTPPGLAIGSVPVTYTGDFGTFFTSPPLTFEYYETPSVTAVVPQEGPSSGGYPITVHGINMNNTAASTFCRVGLQNVSPSPPMLQTYASSSGYVCNVPRGSGVVFVDISLNDGVTFTDDKISFTYFSVFAMVPTLGPSTGDTMVVLSGTGFKDTPLAECMFGTVRVPAEFVSEAEVKCKSPPNVAGNLPVEYTSDGTRFTGDAKLFLYFLTPLAKAIVPPGGPSFGGNMVTLHGANFADVGSSIKCKFGLLTSNGALGSLPDTIECQAPPGSGQVDVAVSLNNGFQFAASSLKYAFVSLSKMTPDHGLLTGGTTVVISGSGFLADLFVKPQTFTSGSGSVVVAGNSTATSSASTPDVPFRCHFGSNAESPAVFLDGSRFQCSSPAHAAGTVPVVLSGPNGFISGDFKMRYTFDEIPITVSQLPVVGPSSGGTRMVVIGANYVVSQSQQCRFGTVIVTGTISFSKTGAKIVCASPPQSGVVEVDISFNEQDFSPVGKFYYYSVSTSTPPGGPTGGGTDITIFGDGFNGNIDVDESPGATPVNVTALSEGIVCVIGSYAGRAKFVSRNEIVCLTPRVALTGGTERRSITSSSSSDYEADADLRGFGDLLLPAVPKKPTMPRTDASIRATTTATSRTSAAAATSMQSVFADPFNTAINGNINRTSHHFSARQLTGTKLLVQIALHGSEELASNGKATFVFFDPFKVTEINPKFGRTAGGLTVTLKGGPFTTSTGVIRCRFGDESRYSVVATFVSRSEITCVTPPHVADAVDVFVSQNDQQWTAPEPEAGKFVFEECAAGFFARVFSDPCSPCPASFFSPNPGSTQCIRCPMGSYADKEGSPECTECPDNSIIPGEERDSIDKCVCVRNFYSVTGLPGKKCLPCPEGGVCPGELAAPYPLPGFWSDRSPSSELNEDEGFVFFECDFKEACLGGGIEECRTGYTGRICSDCAVGYFKRGQRCQECPDSSYFSIAAFFIFIVIVCVGLYKMVGTDVSAYGGTLNIIAYFFQVVGILAKLNLKWPMEVESTMTILSSPFSLDVDVLASECSIPSIGFQVKWVSMMMLPVIFFSVFFAIYVLHKIASLCVKQERGPTQASVGDMLVNAYLLFLALAYLMLVSTAFKIFDCTDRGNGEFTLDAQPSLLCYEPWWWQLAPLALGGIAVYGFVVPLLSALMIHRNRNKLTTPTIVGRYGSIFIDYTPVKPYWESVVMIEKFSFALTMTFFTSFVDVQIIAFLLVSIMGLALQIVARPFFIARYNTLQTILRWASSIMIVAGMVFRAGNFPVEFLRLLVTGIVFLIIAGAIGGVAAIVVYDIIMIRRSLAGAFFPAQTGKYINLITHPQGRTTLMEWLGNTRDSSMKERVANVMNELGAYYEAKFNDAPERTSARRTSQLIINFFSSDIFLDTPLPVIQMWLEERTVSANKRRDPESINILRDFIIVFTELARFRLYDEVGVKRSRIKNLPYMAIPWLDVLEELGPADDSEFEGHDANGLIALHGGSGPSAMDTEEFEEEVGNASDIDASVNTGGERGDDDSDDSDFDSDDSD